MHINLINKYHWYHCIDRNWHDIGIPNMASCTDLPRGGWHIWHDGHWTEIMIFMINYDVCTGGICFPAPHTDECPQSHRCNTPPITSAYPSILSAVQCPNKWWTTIHTVLYRWSPSVHCTALYHKWLARKSMTGQCIWQPKSHWSQVPVCMCAQDPFGKATKSFIKLPATHDHLVLEEPESIVSTNIHNFHQMWFAELLKQRFPKTWYTNY